MKKTVLITGSSSGIGRATAALFKKRGWRVIGVDTRSGTAAVDLFLRTDLARPETVGAVKSFITKNKILRLDALVNNAAVQTVKPFSAITRSDWQDSLAVNAEAPFFLMQALLPQLHNARGSIVNVASIHARLTKKHFSVYAATKGALVALTRALAVELAPRVRVNAVLPAATATPMLKAGFARNPEAFRMLKDCHPLKRIARPEEIAEVIFFLANEQASFITGAAIAVDGGIGSRLFDPAP
ncbi:MAG: SDR family oxidoreductase [Desulfobacterota bacterium]|nr:SDR family oxidoreductase [Thermodesulfobacteriota bacterium]